MLCTYLQNVHMTYSDSQNQVFIWVIFIEKAIEWSYIDYIQKCEYKSFSIQCVAQFEKQNQSKLYHHLKINEFQSWPPKSLGFVHVCWSLSFFIKTCFFKPEPLEHHLRSWYTTFKIQPHRNCKTKPSKWFKKYKI